MHHDELPTPKAVTPEGIDIKDGLLPAESLLEPGVIWLAAPSQPGVVSSNADFITGIF